MNRMLILMGLPGSGKSTLASRLLSEALYSAAKPPGLTPHANLASARIFSTDDYWLRPDGTYDWNAALLRRAHEWNQGRVASYLEVRSYTVQPTTVIIDNTNVTRAERAPYVELAASYGYGVTIVTPTTEWARTPEACFTKTKHGVPLEAILRMASRWED